MDQEAPDYCLKTNLILGCGNVFIGDDAFGPEVVKHLLANFRVPADTEVLNVETSSKPVLFDITLSKRRPKRLIIIDAFDAGRAPGELFEASIGDIPAVKLDDFSLHQMPTSNLLRELQDLCGVEVIVVACQVKRIPDVISPGLSEEVRGAVPRACELVISRTGSRWEPLRHG